MNRETDLLESVLGGACIQGKRNVCSFEILLWKIDERGAIVRRTFDDGYARDSAVLCSNWMECNIETMEKYLNEKGRVKNMPKSILWGKEVSASFQNHP